MTLLLKELGLASALAVLDAQVDVEDGDGRGAMGAVDAEVEVAADDQPGAPMDIPMEDNEGQAGELEGSSSGALLYWRLSLNPRHRLVANPVQMKRLIDLALALGPGHQDLLLSSGPECVGSAQWVDFWGAYRYRRFIVAFSRPRIDGISSIYRRHIDDISAKRDSFNYLVSLSRGLEGGMP